MLVRLLYASHAVSPLTTPVVDTILEQSRLNNPQQGITGLLCFSDDIFIQVLEGGRDAVCELFNAIVRDDRHTKVRILGYEEIAERRFGGWGPKGGLGTTVRPELVEGRQWRLCSQRSASPFILRQAQDERG